jgi:hypothetical protein
VSNHKTPLTDLERKGLEAHGLGRHIGQPSQLADVFRQGVAWALANTAPAARQAVQEPVAICPNCLGTRRPHADDPDWRGRCDCTPPAQPAVPLTEKDLASACLSCRHDFGLMDAANQGLLMFQAREWARAFGLSVTSPPAKGGTP